MTDTTYNVEDNIQASLLGRDLDSSTPWRHHDNAWIRIPTRFIVRVEEFTHIAAFVVALWYGIPQSVTALGEVFWEGIVAAPAVLWRNILLLPILAIILVAGIFLVIQGRRGELNIFLLLFFAWGMVFFAIITRLSIGRGNYESVA